MAEIENIHCPICTQPIPSSWQNGLPPALATDERRGVTDCCLVDLIDVTLTCEDTNSKLVYVVTVVDVEDEFVADLEAEVW